MFKGFFVDKTIYFQYSERSSISLEPSNLEPRFRLRKRLTEEVTLCPRPPKTRVQQRITCSRDAIRAVGISVSVLTTHRFFLVFKFVFQLELFPAR
jgi:hypothetical protein